jgi:hypothetical protein
MMIRPSLLAAGLVAALLLPSCQPKDTQNSPEELARQSADKITQEHFASQWQAQKTLPLDKNEEIERLAQWADPQQAEAVQKILSQHQEKTGKPAQADSLAPNSLKPAENAALLIAIRDYKEGSKKIQQIIEQHKGQILDEDERHSAQRLENTFVVQVHPQELKGLMNSLRDLALVIRQKKIWQQDLSMQVIDLETRIENKKAAQERLREMLKSAKNAQEVLPIQKEMDVVVTELETLSRAAQALSKKQQYATLTLGFYQELPQINPAAQANFGEQVQTGFVEGWANFKAFLIACAFYWAYILSGSLLLLILWFSYLSSRRKDQQLREQALQTQQQWLILQQQKHKN